MVPGMGPRFARSRANALPAVFCVCPVIYFLCLMTLCLLLLLSDTEGKSDSLHQRPLAENALGGWACVVGGV